MSLLKYAVLLELIIADVIGHKKDAIISFDDETNLTTDDALDTWSLLKSSAVMSDTATYSTLWQDCYRNIMTASGNISSPLFPHMYPPRINCDWIIHVPEGYKVRIKFTTFDLPGMINERCRHGFIEFGSFGEDNRRDVKVGHWCGQGSTCIDEFVSPDNRCWVYFTSGVEIVTNTSYSGFMLKFDSLPLEHSDKTNQTLFFTLLLILLPLIGVTLVCLCRRKKYVDPITYDRNASRRFQRRHCNKDSRHSGRPNGYKRVYIQGRKVSDEETALKYSQTGGKMCPMPSGEYDGIRVIDRDYHVYRVMQKGTSNTRCSDVSSGSVFLHENAPRPDLSGDNTKYPRSSQCSGNFLDLPNSCHPSLNASYMSFFPARSESMSTAEPPCYILQTAKPDSSSMETFPCKTSFPGNEQIPVIHINYPEDAHGNKIVSRPPLRKKSYDHNRILSKRIFSAFSDSVAVKSKRARLSLPALYDIQEGVEKSPPHRSESLYSTQSKMRYQPYPGVCRKCHTENDSVGYLPGFEGNYFRFSSPETYSYNISTLDQNGVQVHSIPRPISFCNSDILSEQEHILPPVRKSLLGTRSISVSQSTIQAYMSQECDLDSLMTNAHDKQQNRSLTLSIQSLTALQEDTERDSMSTDQNKCCQSQTMDVDSLTALQQEIQCWHNHSAVGQHYTASPYSADIQTQLLVGGDQISHLQAEFENPSLELSAVKRNPDCNESFFERQRVVPNINSEDSSSCVDVNNNSLTGNLQEPCVSLLDDTNVNRSQAIILEEGESMV